MSPTEMAVIVGVISSVITGLIVGLSNFFAVKTAMARIEERHNALAGRCAEDREQLCETREIHAKRLAAHELEIGLLKRGSFSR
ncbi:MAG TPA: hypothetical protein VM756_05180 [Burkholderiales bacterium]|nr:hypothetical protein [Burkholderiales bacterium]